MKYTEYETELSLICKSSLFLGVEPEEIYAIAEVVKAIEFAEGDIIFNEGSIDNCLFLIARGRAEIFHMTDTGEEDLVMDMGVNDFFGEMAFLTGEPRTATVRSKGDSKLLKISYDQFMISPVFTDYVRTRIVINIAKKLALRLTEENKHYIKKLSAVRTYYADMDVNSIVKLSRQIAAIKRKH